MGDLPDLIRLGRQDLSYLLRRYAIGLRSRLPFRNGPAGRDAYVSRETDLRKMSLRFGAGVRITLDDGRSLFNEVLTPPGFAGDTDRAAVPSAKFRREVGSATSRERAQAILDVLSREPTASPVEVAMSVVAQALDGAECRQVQER